MPPPETRRDDVVESLHGVEIADPYRWLEDTTAPEVRAWIDVQNAWTRLHLDDLPMRGWFAERLTALSDQPRRSVPWRRGAAWLQLRNDGLQDQDVLWTAGADPLAAGTPLLPPDEHWRVLLDPNDWSADGTAALVDFSLSFDGALLAYARSDAGSDWLTWRVLDVGTGQDLGDEVRWAKFTSAAWLPDGAGFVYGGYAPPEPGAEHLAANRDHHLRVHLLGADEDPVVYACPDEPEWTFRPEVTHDGRWLVVTVSHGTRTETRIHVAPIDPRGRIGEIRPLLDDGAAAWTFLGVHDTDLWFLTNDEAPRGRIVTVNATDAADRTEIVPEGLDRIEAARLIGAATPTDAGALVVRTLHHATSRLLVFGLDGQRRDEVPLPQPATSTSVSGGRYDTAVFVDHQTFAAPASIWRHDLDGTTTRVHTVEVDGPDLAVEQVFVEHDGASDLGMPVRVPVFLVRRADVHADGAVPTVLWGYGGFDIPITPQFRLGWRAWVDAGGLLAVACLRGGGEYGKGWHDDGRLHNRQHVFDDALAVADWLAGAPGTRAFDVDGAAVDGAPWTSPAHLGMEGGSNGGLLVGACMTQRPDAFASAVPQVGVLDMLRFHRFTIGWAWTSDYGDPEDPEAFAWLRSWSPLHNLEEGRAYPATLVTTADTDDRVVPAHSFKFAAALQHAQGGDAPVLIRIDVSAGHGAGKPISKVIDERADVLAFHAHHLGLGPH